jgi:hypothetical protein
MWLVVLVFATLASAQVRTGWGLTPPCKVVRDGIADLTQINFLDNCDM